MLTSSVTASTGKDIPSAPSTAASVSATSSSDASSDTATISASISSSIIVSSASGHSLSASSSSSAVLSGSAQSHSQHSSIRLSSTASAPSQSHSQQSSIRFSSIASAPSQYHSQHSSIRLSSIAFSAPTASRPIFFSGPTTVRLSSPSGHFATHDPDVEAPTGLSTVPPSTATFASDSDSTSTGLETHLGVVPIPPSLFTTTITYTSNHHVHTTTSTGVLGTARPIPHNFAHDPAAIIGVTLGCLAFLILLVFAVFCACRRFGRPRTHREFMLRGASRGLRRPPGAWRSPIDGDGGESVYELVDEEDGSGSSSGDHRDDRLLMVENGNMRVSRGVSSAGSFSSYTPEMPVPMPDLMSLEDAVWVPSPPSSSGHSHGHSFFTSDPATARASDSSRSTLSSHMPRRSSLLNPPSSSMVAIPLAAPAATQQQPEWPGLRSSITYSLPLSSVAEPSVTEPTPPTSPEPAPEGLLRPSLAALQSHSSRTLEDCEDYSRPVVAGGAGGGGYLRHRTWSGDTFDTATASSQADGGRGF
ncbi:hypothetical protein B0H12DRAFT_471276 [Mycena haematopus]|nr:hypothetical protein B0H12DRAFT_471276 [Mycena haematopus]